MIESSTTAKDKLTVLAVTVCRTVSPDSKCSWPESDRVLTARHCATFGLVLYPPKESLHKSTTRVIVE